VSESTDPVTPLHQAIVSPVMIARTIIGGALMGVANIIPGVSGGTMILALGLYEQFVTAVADFTRMKFRFASIVFLCILGVSGLLAIFLMVEPINWGLTHHQHVMFALFIGLTLGGVPLILRELAPMQVPAIGGAIGGLGLIVGLTFLLSALDLPANFMFLFVGGVLGSAAMVLPGVSGSYLLLMLGLYFPITAGISEFKDALTAMDMEAIMGPTLGVMLPVGLGVLAGIAGLSNLLKALLRHAHQMTLGVLLGLLLGSVFFLNPFKAPGDKDPFEAAAPITAGNVAIVLFAAAFGFALTYAVSRLGGEEAKDV